MPSFNDVTGDRISSGVHKANTDKQKFRDNWDLVFGKKDTSPEDPVSTDAESDICESCAGLGWVETWGPEGEGSEDCPDCISKNK